MRLSIPTPETMTIKVTTLTDMLGSQCNDPDLHLRFIASKSADAEKIEEEEEALPADTRLNKAMMVFHRHSSGKPMLFDYQFKGFLKNAIGRIVGIIPPVKIHSRKLSWYGYKSIVHDYIHVSPRQIVLDTELGPIKTRPIRIAPPTGPEQQGLVSSETIPAGVSFNVSIRADVPELMDLVKRALDLGADVGLGQWRTGGWGRFQWEIVS